VCPADVREAGQGLVTAVPGEAVLVPRSDTSEKYLVAVQNPDGRGSFFGAGQVLQRGR